MRVFNMSMHLDFEPHSYYKGFAIKKTDIIAAPGSRQVEWSGYTDNGNSYRIDKLHADTLKELKQKITEYYNRIAERDAYNRRMIGEL